MPYDKSIAAAVAVEFEAKKRARAELINNRRSLLYSEIPELKKLDDEIASISFSVFRRVAEGYDPEKAAEEIHSRSVSLTKKRDALIEGAGYDKNFLNPPYDCPYCRDEGFIDNSYCECFKKKLIEAVFSESNLAALSKNRFEDFDLSLYPEVLGDGGEHPRAVMERILTVCKRFAENFESLDDNLLFTGQTGLGKTFLSSCIANRLISRGVSVIYQSAGVVFTLLDKIKFSKTNEEADIYTAKRLTDCDLLILDDLGTEFISDFSVSELFRILNTRLLTKKKTIVSTNLSLQDIKRVYSERTLSRIIGDFTILKFCGNDIRFMKKG